MLNLWQQDEKLQVESLLVQTEWSFRPIRSSFQAADWSNEQAAARDLKYLNSQKVTSSSIPVRYNWDEIPGKTLNQI